MNFIDSKVINWIAMPILIVSTTANFALIRQNVAIGSYVSDLRNQLRVNLNIPMPALTGTSMSGTPLDVAVQPSVNAAQADQMKLVLVLSPTCHFLRRELGKLDPVAPARAEELAAHRS